MKLKLIPNEGTDCIKFGMKPNEISQILDQEGEDEIVQSIQKSENFSRLGLKIFYEKDIQNNWICCEIIFWKPDKINLLFYGKEIFKMKLFDLIKLLLIYDQEIETETDYVKFNKIGILLGGEGLEIESNLDFPPNYVSIGKVDSVM
jgi:hypothetical protein